jgi:hypothetical protein
MIARSTFKKSCSICQSKNVSTINTYKHLWRVCNYCGVAFSRAKKRLPLSFLPFSQLKNQKELLENPSKVYKFSNPSEEAIKEAEEQAALLSDEWINLCKIDLTGKKLIEISGGNGHFLNSLRKFSIKPFHTELNPSDVEYVKTKLKIDSKPFNFYKNNLQNIFPDKFDIILLKGNLEFCLDIKNFLSNIEENTKPGTLIIVVTSVPTLGNFLITQFDDYNQLVLYQKEPLLKIFKESGYSMLWERLMGDTRNDYPLTYYRNKLSRILMLGYMIPAMYKLSPDKRFLFHSLSVRGLHLVFQKGM